MIVMIIMEYNKMITSFEDFVVKRGWGGGFISVLTISSSSIDSLLLLNLSLHFEFQIEISIQEMSTSFCSGPPSPFLSSFFLLVYHQYM